MIGGFILGFGCGVFITALAVGAFLVWAMAEMEGPQRDL